MCAPSRGSVMTGRYPWHVGYYDNNGGGGPPLGFKFLPELLAPTYDSHALGKWHLGWLLRKYTPAWRGFKTFHGSSGNTDDYWYHLNGEKCSMGKESAYDYVTSTAPNADGAGGSFEVDLAHNGTYDTRVLAAYSLGIVADHNISRGLYLYFAFHAVHVTRTNCVPFRELGRAVQLISETPMRAGCDERASRDGRALSAYPLGRTEGDECDAAGAGLGGRESVACPPRPADGRAHGLDLSHRQRSAWLPRLQLAKPGPQVQLLGCAQSPEIARALFRSLMKPMRCLAEGGVNGVAFISSPLLPAARHGTKFDGLAHLSDIYLTVAVGIAQLSIDIAATGPIPPGAQA